MKTIVRPNGEGEKLWFYGGGVHTWKVTAEDTHGALGIFEDTMSRGKVTPLHMHPESDEVIYVLEGESSSMTKASLAPWARAGSS